VQLDESLLMIVNGFFLDVKGFNQNPFKLKQWKIQNYVPFYFLYYS